MDIFHRQQQTVGGVFNTDKAIMTIAAGGSTGVAALVQNVQAEYNQDFTELYSLGDSNVYRVLGRPKGRMTIGRIVAVQSTDAIGDALFNACVTNSVMTIGANASGCAGISGSVQMNFHGIFVISYGISIAVNDMLIRENVVLAFNSFNKT